MLITILGAVFVFGVIVMIHELGHFLTAKACGMRVDEFAIGIGPNVVQKQKGETLYSLRLLPLGGFNKIAGMDPSEDAGERGFNSKPVWQRFIVIAAGATFNFLLAIVIYFFVFAFHGTTVPSHEPIIGDILAGNPAATAGIQKGDKIVSINGQSIKEWKNITESLKGHSNHVVSVTLDRNGETISTTVIPRESGDRAVIGINPVLEVKEYSIGESAVHAVSHTGSILTDMVQGLWNIVTGHSKGDVAGPIGVAQMAGQVAQHGFISLLLFTALLSLNLGVINLLPIPVLDGGHLVLLILEGITGRKLPEKALQYIQMTGVGLLLLVFVYSTFQDILRLF